jgi:hypothetical protein
MEDNICVNVYYRADDILCKGKGFKLDGYAVTNGLIRYSLSAKELDVLYDNKMVMHEDIIIVPYVK